MEENKTMMAAVEDTTAIAETENEEIVKETLLTKGAKFVKKHAKKIAAGAVILGVAVIGHAVGKRAASELVDYEIEDAEDETEVDMDDSDMESEE